MSDSERSAGVAGVPSPSIEQGAAAGGGASEKKRGRRPGAVEQSFDLFLTLNEVAGFLRYRSVRSVTRLHDADLTFPRIVSIRGRNVVVKREFEKWVNVQIWAARSPEANR